MKWWLEGLEVWPKSSIRESQDMGNLQWKHGCWVKKRLQIPSQETPLSCLWSYMFIILPIAQWWRQRERLVFDQLSFLFKCLRDPGKRGVQISNLKITQTKLPAFTAQTENSHNYFCSIYKFILVLPFIFHLF